MDIEYFKNVIGSPYIDEGLGDRITAKGISGVQRLSAMSGGSIYGPVYVKAEVIFNKFIKRIIPILKEFAEGNSSVSVKLKQMKPAPNAQQLKTIQKIIDLYQFVAPTFFQSQLVKNIKTESQSHMIGILKEGIFSRKLSLGSGNISTILNTYIKDIKNSYDELIRDMIKVTNTSPEQVRKTIGSLNKKWGPVLNKTEIIPGVKFKQDVIDQPSIEQPSVPTTQQEVPSTPSASQTTFPSKQEPTEHPKNLPGQIVPAANSVQSLNNPQPSTAVNNPPISTSNKSQLSQPVQPSSTTSRGDVDKLPSEKKNEIIIILNRVVDIIIDAIKHDTTGSGKKFISDEPGVQKDLPTDWETEPITKLESLMEDEEDDTDKEDGGNSHDFLYNFHSKYNKYPGTSFSLEIKPFDKNLNILDMGNGDISNIRVIWNNVSGKNDIYVQQKRIKKDGIDIPNPKSIQRLILRGYDHDIDPRGTHPNKFSIEELYNNANPSDKSLFATSDPKLVEELNSKTNFLQRALYAVTFRKTMEFKPRHISIFYDSKTEHFMQKTKDENIILTKEKVLSHLISPDEKERSRWIKALTDKGYFDVHPDVAIEAGISVPGAGAKKGDQSKIDISKIPGAIQAHKDLSDLGYASIRSLGAVQKSVEKLGDGKHHDEYYNLALKILKTQDESISSLVALGVNKKEAEKNIESVSSKMPADAEINDYIKLFLPNKVKTADKNEQPPVSSENPKPDVAPSVPGEKELGEASWDDKGNITWKKPDGKVRQFHVNNIKNIQSEPLQQLLKLKGYYDQFPNAKRSGKEPEKLEEDLINPFQFINFV